MTMNVPLIELNNGQSIPILGFGTWNLDRNDTAQVIKDAIDCGYRHFDCAHCYRNEKEFGDGIKAKLDDGTVKREDLFITSKIWQTHLREDLVIQGLRKTLTDFKLEYVDLFLIHWPIGMKWTGEFVPLVDGKIQFSDVHYTEAWRGLETCHKEGLAKSIGLSNFNKRQISTVLEMATVKPVINQVECHPYFTQKKLIKFCSENNIAVTAYSPLGSPARPEIDPNLPVVMRDPKLKELADKYKKDQAQIMIKYQLQNRTIVIPYSSIKSRIKSNFDVFDFEISPSDMEALEGLNQDLRLNTVPLYKDQPGYPFHDEY